MSLEDECRGRISMFVSGDRYCLMDDNCSLKCPFYYITEFYEVKTEIGDVKRVPVKFYQCRYENDIINSLKFRSDKKWHTPK